ncbi:MAG: hypothetical protein HOG33_01250 [Candidatus Marinimicrobia bacterium]|nr:hypothetical protein [Candidatus Neomarinimicrobiota bacterium]
MKRIDPKKFNLSKKVVIEKTTSSLSIIINRKTRIIMKDGRRLLEQANQIKKVSNKPVSIFTTAPVCSKTKAFLSNNNVEIIQEKKM